jgi:Flp pilus assembly protein TadD
MERSVMQQKNGVLTSLLTVLALLAVLGACRSVPELRPSAENASPASFEEGKRLLEEGRTVEAVSTFRRHLREKGADLNGLNALAIAYAELGHADLAAEMFGRALALKPDDAATLNNIGFAALRRADGRLARRYLEQARRQGDMLDEIDGNIERLHLLEMVEAVRSRSPALRQAAWHGPEQQPSAVVHLSIRKPTPRTPTPSAEETATPTSPKPELIDFMTVNDPFSPNTRAK